jgi:hypothetical protein
VQKTPEPVSYDTGFSRFLQKRRVGVFRGGAKEVERFLRFIRLKEDDGGHTENALVLAAKRGDESEE